MKDLELTKCLTDLKAQSVKLRLSEGIWSKAEATKKTNFAQLFLKAEGKSVAEREHAVYASEEWINFSLALAGYQTDLNWEKRKFDILQMAYYAQLNQLKAESMAIARTGT